MTIRPMLLVATGLALGLLLGEAMLRLYPIPAIEIHRRGAARDQGGIFFEYDSDLGWRGRPRARGILAGLEFTSEIALNTLGFRDPEVAIAKPSGTFRVVLLGDSITWGHGVDQAGRYGDLLAEVLRRRRVVVQVVNLAVSGYGTDQELLLWQRIGRHYCADVVLLGLYENDVRENEMTFQGRYPKPYFRASVDGALAVANVPVPRVTDWEARPPERGPLREWFRRHVRLWAALAFVRQAVRGDATAVPPPAPSPGSVDLTAALIRRLAASARGAGSVFGVVVLPDLYYSATMMQAASRSGVAAILDLAPVFRSAGEREPLYYRFDGAHWTPRAHKLAAEAIGLWMLTAPLLPRSPRACAASR